MYMVLNDYGCRVVDGNSIRCARGTCLHSAAAHGHVKTVQLLLNSKSRRTSKTRNTVDTALHIAAAANGAVEVMEVLLEAGADPNTYIHYKQYEDGKESNINATLRRPNINSVLLPCEADMDKYLCKALHVVASRGYVRAVQLLLQAGALAEGVDRFGHTALHFAAQCGHVEVLQVLLHAGIPVDVRGQCGNTALHLAARSGHVDAFRLLLHAGADIHAVNTVRRNCLHFAACGGNMEIFRLLLAAGFSVRSVDQCSSTVLHFAAEAGRLELLMALLNAGCNVNAINNLDRSALSCAVERGNMSETIALLRAGADTHNVDVPLHSAHHHALVGRNHGVLSVLVTAGIHDDVGLLTRTRECNVTCLSIAMSHGKPTDTAALLFSITKGHKEVARS